MINAELQSDPVYLIAYKQLSELNSKYDSAGVFAPHFPPTWAEECRKYGLPKILWCGSATRGWGNDGNKFPSSASGDFLEKGVEYHSKNSRFWKTIGNVGQHLSKDKANEVKVRKDLIIWNNLWRIGGQNGEPNSSLKRAQLELCVMALRREIEISKPDVVVLHIGNLAHQFTERYFSLNTGKPTSNTGRVHLYDGDLAPPHIWMTRKRSLSNADCLADALSGLRAAKVI